MKECLKILSILIPVYNEEKTIEKLLSKVEEVDLPPGIVKEIVVVNDCSTDGTLSVLEQWIASHVRFSIKVYNHTVNSGKGAAVRTALSHATGHYIVIQDADLEYNPAEYSRMLAPIMDGRADIVYGSRFITGSERRVLYYWHYLGNKLLTSISNAFTNLNLTDMETCYKMFTSDISNNLNIQENRFGLEPEMTAKFSKMPDVRIYEVGISYSGRTYKEGKKIGWKDGVRAIYCIIKYNLSSK